jgi:hypothetical protein
MTAIADAAPQDDPEWTCDICGKQHDVNMIHAPKPMTDAAPQAGDDYAGHTEGPWFWHVDMSGRVSLRTPDRGQLVVMDVARRGMQGAAIRFSVMPDGQPRGRRGGILETMDPRTHADGRLIAAAPMLRAEIERLTAALAEAREVIRNIERGYCRSLEAGRDRIIFLGGDCDPLERMIGDDPDIRDARAWLVGNRARVDAARLSPPAADAQEGR